MRGEVGGNRVDEGLGAGRRTARDTRHTELGGDGAREGFHLAGLHRDAMIGAATGDRRGRFGDVETAHALGRGVETAARGEGARVLHAEGVLGGEEIAVEREDHVRLREVVHGLDVFAERGAGAGADVVARGRFPLNPLGLRMRGENLLDLRGERRRVHRLREDAEPGAAGRGLGREGAADGADEAAPGTHLTELGGGARAVRVVEGQNRRLREEVGAALARRMIGVALDLRRPAFVALDEQPRGHAAERRRGREEQRLAGHDLFGLPHVRHDELVGLHGAGGDAGQCERRAHQLQEAAAAHRIVPFRRVGRELAVEEFLELGRFRHGFKAAPVLRAAGARELGANGVEV